MFRLGEGFFREYYRILIKDGCSIIVCAFNSSGDMVGFVSGTLDVKVKMLALTRNRLSLLAGSLPALIRDHTLLAQMISRERNFAHAQTESRYVVQSGAIVDFWAWKKNEGSGAIPLLLKWLAILRSLGLSSICGEVDVINNDILRIHRMLGAKVIKEFVTPDGRERVLIRYTL